MHQRNTTFFMKNPWCVHCYLEIVQYDIFFQVTASNDFNLKLWDMKQKKEKLTMTGHTSAINALAYSVSTQTARNNYEQCNLQGSNYQGLFSISDQYIMVVSLLTCRYTGKTPGPTVIKLFESENELKCKNCLHDFMETLCLFSKIWGNHPRHFTIS